MSAFEGPSDGELRLALAELIRDDDVQLDEPQRRAVRRVVYWADASRTRYPGTSSTWEEHAIEVTYETWDGGRLTWRWMGSYLELLERLARLVEDY